MAPPVPTETDPLVWWKGEKGRFPTLANPAQKYLCVCVVLVYLVRESSVKLVALMTIFGLIWKCW